MNPGISQNTNNSSSPKLTSFIEALKQRQQSRGSLASPDRPSPFSFPEINKNKELEKKRIEQFHQARSKEWAGVYSAKQKQMEKRIEEIREQLKILIKQVVKFDLNVIQAVSLRTREPGNYHINFFEHIGIVIELMKKDIVEANSWLSLYNQRSKKIGHYWGMAKKKGASFTLNDERQIATSIG
ncbi:hypothetical protein KJ953_04475 [Patescibacteria group bacterium]|nr:hypothetical protein [Patescibacteria group bacterium]